MPKKLKHNSLWIVIVWLVLAFIFPIVQAIVTQTTLPVKEVVIITGLICLGYVGISKALDITKAFKAPAGDFGFEYVPAMKTKTLWMTIISLLLILEILIVQAIVGNAVDLPVEEAITFCGTVSIAYVSANKGLKVAACCGKEKNQGVNNV